MTTILDRSMHEFAYAIGPADLTAFDNGQVKLAVGELNSLDKWYDIHINETDPLVEEIPSESSDYNEYLENGVIRGIINGNFRFQTPILTYWIMGACTTTEGSPDTQAITKATTKVPPYLAFHYEIQGSTAAINADSLGVISRSLDISVSEKDTKARQAYRGEFAITKAGDAVTTPTPQALNSYPQLEWFNYKDASGASAFLYNAGAINLQITEVHLHFSWADILFGEFDGDGYPTEAWWVGPFTPYVELGGRPTDAGGTSIRTIANTKPSSYAGDLDLIVDFYVSASHYIKFTYDKLRLLPNSREVMLRRDGDWYDGERFRLIPLDDNFSISIEAKNELNNDYFENPA